MPIDITKNTNHIAETLERLLWQFHGQPVNEGINASYVDQIQDLEDVFIDLLLLRMLDNAEGAQLDGLGDIVGELRLGRNDTDYHAAISGRIRINRIHSRIDEILLVMTLVQDREYDLWERGNAGFFVRVRDTLSGSDPDPVEFWTALQRAKGGGVVAYFQYQEVDDDKIFQFASGDIIEVSSDQGFANDGQTTGGSWSDLVDY